MTVLQDGNVPAFQSFTVVLTPGEVLAEALVLNVYLTPRSWIGVTPLDVGDAPGRIAVNRQLNGLTESWDGGYQKNLAILSNNADDDRTLSVVIITAPGMGQSYPGQAPS